MNPFTVSLTIIPSFSRHVLLILSILTVLTIAVVVYLPIGLLIKLAGCFLILIWFIATIREHCWHSGTAIKEAILRTDNVWLLYFNNADNDQKPTKAELLPGCLIQPWLTVLQFKVAGQGKKSLILLKDNIDPDTFRRLRVRLKNSEII